MCLLYTSVFPLYVQPPAQDRRLPENLPASSRTAEACIPDVYKRQPQAYKVATDICKNLEECIVHKLDETETGYLAMHIQRVYKDAV